MSAVLPTPVKACSGDGPSLPLYFHQKFGDVATKINLDYQDPCLLDGIKDKYAGIEWPTMTFVAPIGATVFLGNAVRTMTICMNHFHSGFRQTSDSNDPKGGGVDVIFQRFRGGRCFYKGKHGQRVPISEWLMTATALKTYQPLSP